jgi:small subunit ribosomal protein S21
MAKHYNPNLPKNFGLTVEVQNGNVEQALRKFKKKVNNSGIIQEYRERTEYVKPTTKRTKAKKQAVSRNKKRVSQELGVRKRLY